MRVVVKVGTSTLAHGTGCLNIRRVEELCRVLSDLKNSGEEVILVSSGAIAMGVGKLHLAAKPSDLAGKQACAAVGQCELMYAYDKMFAVIILISAISLLLMKGVELLQKRCMPWEVK